MKNTIFFFSNGRETWKARIGNETYLKRIFLDKRECLSYSREKNLSPIFVIGKGCLAYFCKTLKIKNKSEQIIENNA